MRLREHPHCNNCEHLKRRKGFHCAGLWKGRIHPEQAGHIVQRVDDTISLYHINCSHYRPKKHVKE